MKPILSLFFYFLLFIIIIIILLPLKSLVEESRVIDTKSFLAEREVGTTFFNSKVFACNISLYIYLCVCVYIYIYYPFLFAEHHLFSFPFPLHFLINQTEQQN